MKIKRIKPRTDNFWNMLKQRQKKGFQVTESLAYINRNGKYCLNAEFCKGIMKKEIVEMMLV